MSSETIPPFTKTRDGLSWPAILKLIGYALPFIIGAGMLYLGKEFATHNEVRAAVAAYEPLPSRVQSLEEFRGRQEQTQARSEVKMEAVQTTLATISAQQTNTDKKLDRLLDTVERMNRRTP